MPRISRVTNFPLRYGYLFDIQTPEEVWDWFVHVRLEKSKEEYQDAYQSREAGNPRGYHARAGANVVSLAKIKGISIVDALTQLNTDVEAAMRRVLKETGRIFINHHGAFFATSKSLEISDTHMIPTYVLPEDKPRIIQWAQGQHFYAKHGSDDVVWGGKQKWDTRAEAEQAAAEYMKASKRP